MNLYEIKIKLEKQEKKVFRLNEIARIIGKTKKVSAVYVNRMCKKNLLFKIEKNKFSLSDDVFIIASQLTFPSYLGLTTSLYLYNIVTQVINKIYVISSKYKRKMKILETEIIFIKTKPRNMFGYGKIKKGDSFILVSDIEKTIIDSLIFYKYCRFTDIFEALKRADINKLEYYLSLIKKEHLNRKIGCALDSLKIKHNIKRKTKTIYKLNPLRKTRGKFNNKWFLYINEELK